MSHSKRSTAAVIHSSSVQVKPLLCCIHFKPYPDSNTLWLLIQAVEEVPIFFFCIRLFSRLLPAISIINNQTVNTAFKSSLASRVHNKNIFVMNSYGGQRNKLCPSLRPRGKKKFLKKIVTITDAALPVVHQLQFQITRFVSFVMNYSKRQSTFLATTLTVRNAS